MEFVNYNVQLYILWLSLNRMLDDLLWYHYSIKIVNISSFYKYVSFSKIKNINSSWFMKTEISSLIGLIKLEILHS